MTEFGYLYELEINPCGCHPYDVVMTYQNHDFSKNNSVCYSFSSRYKLNKFIENRFIKNKFSNCIELN